MLSLCPHEEFDIRIKSLNLDVFSIKVSQQTIVSEIKQRIAQARNIDVSLQRIIFRGRMLQDPQTVSACHINPQSVVHLIVRRETEPSPAPETAAADPQPAEAPADISTSFRNFTSRLFSSWRSSSALSSFPEPTENTDPPPQDTRPSVGVNIIVSTSLNFSLIRDHIVRAANLLRDSDNQRVRSSVSDLDSLPTVFEDISRYALEDLVPALEGISGHLRSSSGTLNSRDTGLPDVRSVAESLSTMGRIFSNIGMFLDSEQVFGPVSTQRQTARDIRPETSTPSTRRAPSPERTPSSTQETGSSSGRRKRKRDDEQGGDSSSKRERPE